MARDWLSILGVSPSMSRMPQMANPNTLGPSFHTPTQADFRRSAVGQDGRSLDADPRKTDPATGMAPADNNACLLTRHPDGSASTVRLDANSDGWIDLGGQNPRDMKVVNW